MLAAITIASNANSNVATGIATFRRDGPYGGFRAWLRTITRYKVGDHYRRSFAEPFGAGGSTAQEQFSRIAAPEEIESDVVIDSPAGRLWQHALEFGRAHFDDATWASFWGMVVEGRSAADIAEELGMTARAVRQRKYRALRRLRQKFDPLNGVE